MALLATCRLLTSVLHHHVANCIQPAAGSSGVGDFVRMGPALSSRAADLARLHLKAVTADYAASVALPRGLYLAPPLDGLLGDLIKTSRRVVRAAVASSKQSVRNLLTGRDQAVADCSEIFLATDMLQARHHYARKRSA